MPLPPSWKLRARHQTLARTADRVTEGLYPDPDPCDTYEAWVRSRHDDIEHLDLEQIERELWRARARWACTERRSEWLQERIGRLQRRRAHLLRRESTNGPR